VSETSVRTNLLQSLEIVTELGVDTVGEDLEVLAVDNVALSVQEPGWDLVLGRVLDDGDDTLKLFGSKLSGAVLIVRTPSFLPIPSPLRFDEPLVEVNIGLLADQVGVAATDTLYLRQGVHDLLLAIDLFVHPSVSAALLFSSELLTLVFNRRKMY